MPCSICRALGQLVIEAFAILALDLARAERNALGDENTGAGELMNIREVTLGYRNWKVRQLRQYRQPHLSLHHVPGTIANYIVEIAREFHEQVGMQARLWFVIYDGQPQLAARSTARELRALRYRGNTIIRSELAGRVKSPAEKARPLRPAELRYAAGISRPNMSP